ncbi:hypothetical protein B0H17DRAFT_1190139 [Mycena rosella]|uniref:Uncharacterized protein n=1 Tax=Mycena rosella TaxID=1033263 RepID=A0AAD7MC59_MYCRO|nr:hypothetical protein B0H17DRAFT_1190139 [Mycena rosella]
MCLRTAVDVLSEEEEDEALTMGDFADALGDDLELRELGITAEFGMASWRRRSGCCGLGAGAEECVSSIFHLGAGYNYAFVSICIHPAACLDTAIGDGEYSMATIIHPTAVDLR